MAIGERIRWFRKAKGLTQKELGVEMGFSEHTADIRVRQYESGQRKPKEDMVKDLSRIFGVAEGALAVPDIDTYQGIMHTLFVLEDLYGLTITKLDDQVCLKMDVNHDNYSRVLADDLRSWYGVKEKVTSGSMLVSDYDEWRYTYPECKAEEQRISREEIASIPSKEGAY